MYDLKEIKLDYPLEKIISKYTKLQKNGKEYIGICPFHQEKTPSFTVVPERHFYHCHGCGVNGDVVDFVKAIQGVGVQEACRIITGDLEANNKINKVERVIEEVDLYEGLIPAIQSEDCLKGLSVTPEIFNPKRDTWKKYKPTMIFSYKDVEGGVIGWVIRLDIGNKKIPLTVQMVTKGESKPFLCLIPFTKPRTLYGIETIRDKGTIYIVEGEKTADALMKVLGSKGQVIAWSLGCNGVDKTKWDLLPPNRDYVLIPDADAKVSPDNGEVMGFEEQIGYKAMSKVFDRLLSPGKVFMVDTHDMGKVKDGWDIADVEFSKAEFRDWMKPRLIKMKTEPSVKPVDVFDEGHSAEIEVKVKKHKTKINYDDTHFRCLGFSGKTYYFYHKSTGQIWGFTAKEINKSQMIMLAPLHWWECEYPKGKNGVDWDVVLDFYLRIQEKIGVFDNETVRGRGAWIDNGKPLLHLGSEVVINGDSFAPEAVESEFIYTKSASLSVDYGTYLPATESSKLVALCRMTRWEKPYFGEILAGWMFASLVCGVMPFRSHLYLTGESGSGKSWIMDNIVKVAMGKMPLYCSSTTTEAGIRKALNGDVRPVVFNEAEAESVEDNKRMQGIFILSRQASDEHASSIRKGMGDGESYLCRSSFLFASINKSTSKGADENRTVFIELGCLPKNSTQAQKIESNVQFKNLERKATELLSSEFVGSLLTRAIHLTPQMRANHTIFADIGARETGARRIGDRMAMVLTGLYSLQYDDIVSEKKAKELVSKLCHETNSNEVIDSQEVECLDVLMYSEITVEDKHKYSRKIQVAKAIEIIIDKNSADGFSHISLHEQLKAKGIMIKNEEEGKSLLLAGKKGLEVAKMYKDTQFSSSWKEALRRLDGVEAIKTTHFCKTLKTSGIKIPMKHIIKAP